MRLAPFIVLEGIGGVGKSTVSSKIAEFFEAHGMTVVRTREPGGTDCAEHIRTLVKQGFPGTAEKMSPMGVALLFNAARADHMVKVVTPARNAGELVLCDRFCDSTFVYQSVVNGMYLGVLQDLHDLAIGEYPSTTFLLDCPAEVAQARITPEEQAEDQFDRAALDQQEAMRTAYLSLAAAEPGRYVVIDASVSPDQVYAQILPHLMQIHNDHVTRPKPMGIRPTLVG